MSSSEAAIEIAEENEERIEHEFEELEDAQPLQGDSEEDDPLLDEATPARDRRLHTNPFDFAVRSLGEQIDDKSLVLQDQFQRRRVWDELKSSRLIESLILNVPIPVCYFAELDDGTHAVVDGQQRLTALYRFLTNQFQLRGLRIRPDLNKLRMLELPAVEQRLIKSRTIRCIVILKESHPEIRFDVFERLNSATVSLNRQELRNSTYRGATNDLVVTLCNLPRFLELRRAKTPDKRMRDAELVLRFLAFFFDRSTYKGRFTRHLDRFLEKGRNASQAVIDEEAKVFSGTLEKAYLVFGDQAFRRINERGTYDAQINSAVYDVIMQTFAQCDAMELQAYRAEILEAYRELCMENEEFRDAISRATRDKSRLNTRLTLWVAALNMAGVECPDVVFG